MKPGLLPFVLLLPLIACGEGGDGSPSDAQVSGMVVAPTSLSGLTLRLVRMGDPPVEDVWAFPADAGPEGMAMLQTMEDPLPLPYRYEKTAPDRTRLSFTAGADGDEEVYDMTWTSASQGTFEYLASGDAEPIPGSFQVE